MPLRAFGLNLGGLLDRLGIQRSGLPPQVWDLIVPTIQVADAREVVPPLRGAVSWQGLEMAATAGNNAIWRIVSSSAGGMWIRFLSLQGGGAASVMTLFTGRLDQPGNPFSPPPAPPADPYLQVILRTAQTLQMTPQRTVSVLACGEGYAAPSIILTIHPSVQLAANTRQTYLYNWFVPPGAVLLGESSLANPGTLKVDMLIEEVIAGPLTDR